MDLRWQDRKSNYFAFHFVSFVTCLLQQVEIENANIQCSSSTITLNGKQLNSGEKSIVAEKSAIKIGSIDLVYKRVEGKYKSYVTVLLVY